MLIFLDVTHKLFNVAKFCWMSKLMLSEMVKTENLSAEPYVNEYRPRLHNYSIFISLVMPNNIFFISLIIYFIAYLLHEI